MTKKTVRTLCLFMSLIMMCLSAFAEEDEELSLLDLIGDSTFVLSSDYYPAEDNSGSSAAESDEETDYIEKDGSVIVTISAAGDLFPSQDMQRPDSFFSQEAEKCGGNLAFTMNNIRSIFMDDDLSLVNFQGCIGNVDPYDATLYSLAPVGFENVLKDGGIDAVSMANPACAGNPYLDDTCELLDEAGVSNSCSGNFRVVTVKGVDIGIVSFDCLSKDNNQLMQQIPSAIKNAKLQAQIVIAYFTWGNDGWYKPSDSQIEYGRLAADSGASLVIGSGSQRIQPIENYNGVYICYSLGNFARFCDDKPGDMTSLIVQARFRVKDGVAAAEEFRIVPIRISSKSERNDFAPTPLVNPASIDGMISTMRENSRGLLSPLETYPTEWK